MNAQEKINIESLLPKMEAFTKTLHHMVLDVDIKPKKNHIGACINYSDLIQLREEFLKELLASVTRFVYSKAKGKSIVSLLETDHETEDAYVILNQQAREKFRPYSIQGQFSELLLFNLLQYHFKAVPLIRKMKITTNVQLERNGADAIHIAIKDNKYILYLGEAKSYTSGFKAAFKQSLISIIDTYSKHRNELNLYKYEDFLEQELIEVANDYINYKLENIEVHMVCIITYCVGDITVAETREKNLEIFMQSVKDQVKKILDTDYPEIKEPILARINYIFMPINGLNKLLEEFHKKLGI